LIDKEGKVKISPQFSKAYIFNGEKLTAVESGGKWGTLIAKVKLLSTHNLKMLYLEGNLAFVKSGAKWGLIDENGNYTILRDMMLFHKITFIYYREPSAFLVKTDVFTLSEVTSKFNFDAPEGITFSTTMSEILSKFKKQNLILVKIQVTGMCTFKCTD